MLWNVMSRTSSTESKCLVCYSWPKNLMAKCCSTVLGMCCLIKSTIAVRTSLPPMVILTVCAETMWSRSGWWTLCNCFFLYTFSSSARLSCCCNWETRSLPPISHHYDRSLRIYGILSYFNKKPTLCTLAQVKLSIVFLVTQRRKQTLTH
jgi:hypothetical protein